jgi:uncharacterized repeat protein (TIGR01451 family)
MSLRSLRKFAHTLAERGVATATTLPYRDAVNNLSRAALAFLVAATMLSSASAQPATDFLVTLERASAHTTRLPDYIAAGEPLAYLIRWHVDPEASSDVILEVDVPGVVVQLFTDRDRRCTTAGPVRCTLASADGAEGVIVVGVRIDAPGTHTTVARLIHEGPPDSNPSNDTATHNFDVLARPSLRVFPNVLLPHRLEPGQRSTFSIVAQNRAATPATNVVLTITLPEGGTIESGTSSNSNATCAVVNNALNCTVASLGQDQNLIADFVYTAPFRTTGEDLFIAATVTSAEEDLETFDNVYRAGVMMPRQFVVENTQDQGTGSLRQAILDIGTLCTINEPCEIAFRIPAPVPANGWFTIQPHTPLPEISGNLTMDGRTQTAFTGDTNADGPEIEINGALVPEGSGLRLRPNCMADVRHLAVNGFPGYGIVVRRQESFDDHCIFALLARGLEIAENYLGTDPRGRTAKPNQRGLGIFAAYSRVKNNLIGGNRRAGIYAADSHMIEITGNRIGIGTGGEPLGNGAGMFLDVGGSLFGGTGGADVAQNVIAYNQGMAIARTRRGAIHVTGNSMFDNLLQGIDIDLDGPTPNREADVDAPNRPRLISAIYDPVRNVTVIRGRLDSNAAQPVSPQFIIELYASSRLSIWAYPQAETLLRQESLGTGHEEFEMTVPGDLRGKWITATNTVMHSVGWARTPATESHRSSRPGNTSELSEAIAVQ